MDRYNRSNSYVVERSISIETYMAQVYGWMTCGLLLTAFVSWYTYKTPVIINFIFSSQIAFFGLVLAQLGLVFVISSMIHRLSGSLATSLFMFYSVLTGLTISSIFITYIGSSIASAFLIASGMFGVMSLYGYVTQRDLRRFDSILFMGLIGILLATVVNFWLKNNTLMWIVTYLSVILFVGLTAYDTQNLKNIGQQINANDSEGLRKYSIVGALTLYLDFINLFLILLRICGNKR